MSTILIPREPIPVALTAEQVVVYLLRTGWRQLSEEDSPGWSSFMSHVGRRFVGWSNEHPSARDLGEAVVDIARAESRPAEQVAADIAGPAVGTVGVGCES